MDNIEESVWRKGGDDPGEQDLVTNVDVPGRGHIIVLHHQAQVGGQVWIRNEAADDSLERDREDIGLEQKDDDDCGDGVGDEEVEDHVGRLLGMGFVPLEGGQKFYHYPYHKFDGYHGH